MDMDDRPLILMTPCTQQKGAEFEDGSLSLSYRYVAAIQAAGALPWVIPASLGAEEIAACVRRTDGVLLTGGDDVQPELYTKELPPDLKRTVSEPDAPRDYLELKLIEEVFQQRKPLLAICRGHQLLNVALGGSLIVDIPTQLPQALDHRRYDLKNGLVHEVDLAPNSLLAGLVGQPQISVNSTHHQAVDRVPRPLRATGASPDGVVEGMELHPQEAALLPFLLSVQFHPERLYQQYPLYLKLFQAFVDAATQNRREPL